MSAKRLQDGKPVHSLESPWCSCVSITLQSDRKRESERHVTTHKNRYNGTESNFVAIVQLSVTKRNVINLCPVC